MEKYLYLTEVEWADTWINGGEVPISLASRYLSEEREGTLTPDENLIYDSPVDITKIGGGGLFKFGENFSCPNITIKDLQVNGEKMPDIISAQHVREDGLILSFSNKLCSTIAEKLKKKACVKINNIEKLKKKLDKQLGCKGIMDYCEYTKSHKRSHFLKSYEDEWQQEYRIFWKSKNEKMLKIPSGTAVLVMIYD